MLESLFLWLLIGLSIWYIRLRRKNSRIGLYQPQPTTASTRRKPRGKATTDDNLEADDLDRDAPEDSHDDAQEHIYQETQRDQNKDAWEGAFYDVPAQHSAKKRVQIAYRDGYGNETTRVVDIRAFEPRGSDGLVIGHCHMRAATRTFRFDRMASVVDMETGEIILDLQRLLNDEWGASPEPVLDKLFKEHHDVLKLMLYMAKADGAARAAEIEVIAQHCRELTGDERLDAAMVKDMLQYVDLPTTVTFTRIYNKLRREKPEDARRAAEACRAIVGTQKTIHAVEQAALDALDKPLPK